MSVQTSGGVRIRTPHRLALAIVLALAPTLCIALAPAGTAFAKSFSMPSVRIDALVGADGSLTVEEERTFSFDGDFTRVYWILDPPSGGVYSGISVTGPSGLMPPATVEGRPAGYSRIIPTGGATQVEAYGEMSNETVTYTLRYHVTAAATRWSDTSELNWQCVAPNWEVGTGEVEAVIHLPAGVTASQVKAWAHGPLTGSVHIQPDASVILTLSDLPAETFVEPRILFPAEALSAVAPGTEPRLEKVLAEEEVLAEAANERRARARRETGITSALGIGLPLLLLAIAVPLFLRYGREHRTDFKGRYFREDPADLHPALVSYLMNMGQVKDSSMSAALMRLADRGAIRMEPVTVSKPFLFGQREESTYLLTLVREKWGSLERLDQNLLSFLFTEIAGDDTLTIDEMKSEAKARAQTFHDGVADFKSLVAQEADAAGLLEKSSRTMRVLAWVMTFFAGGATFFGTCAAQNVIAAFVGGGATVALATLAALMPRRSTEAAALFARYRGLRNYLRDFSRLDEAPPTSVVLWNHFLVLAVVFGVADRVIEQLRVRVPEVVGDPGFATTYWWAYSGAGYASPVNALSGGFASAASIASSELSSSSGGGGG